MSDSAAVRDGAAHPTDISGYAEFRRGFVALLPLWAGAIPVGLAFGVAARGIGLSFAETQLMSMLVFSAAAQLSAVSLLGDGAPGAVIIVTALLLNAQALLLGLAVARATRTGRLGRLSAAFLLTDGAYAVALSSGRLTLPGILGTGASMYLAWNIGTAVGAGAGQALNDPSRYGVDLVAPLMFLAVLIPLVRSRPALTAVLVAGTTTLTLAQVAPRGIAVLAACLAGSLAAAWLAGRVRA